MELETRKQRTYQYSQDTYLLTWIEAFLIDRKAQRLAAGSIRFYQQKLKLFTDYCDSRSLTHIDQMESVFIRAFLLYLEETGHNAGGIHAAYRAVKAFLHFYEGEAEPAGWRNPIKNVKAPKVPEEIIEPVSMGDIGRLLDICQTRTFTGFRDTALILALLDTGARAQEICSMDLADYDQINGAILVKQGKGRKPRTVYLGKKSRRALRAYLKTRSDNSPALWVTDSGERICYWGLRSMIGRRAKQASIPAPTLHDFRRAFALNFLRNNPGDIFSLQRIMGHSSLHVLRRYLAQTDEDLQQAHRRGSPVDNGII
jgi:integrase/recombinase XerD